MVVEYKAKFEMSVVPTQTVLFLISYLVKLQEDFIVIWDLAFLDISEGDLKSLFTAMRPWEDLVLGGGCAPIPTLDAKLPLTHFVAVGSEKISGQLSGLVISSIIWVRWLDAPLKRGHINLPQACILAIEGKTQFR